eukprot:scaffold1506_cov118-Isochrysis_galbana.AAC.6
MAGADPFQIARDRHMVRWAASTREAALSGELGHRGRPQVRPRHEAGAVEHDVVHGAVEAAVECCEVRLAHRRIRAAQPARKGVGLQDCVRVLSAGCIATLLSSNSITTPASACAFAVTSATAISLAKSSAVAVTSPPDAPPAAVLVPPRLPQAPIPE